MLRNSMRYAEEAANDEENSSKDSTNYNIFEDFVDAIFEMQRLKQMKPKYAWSIL